MLHRLEFAAPLVTVVRLNNSPNDLASKNFYASRRSYFAQHGYPLNPTHSRTRSVFNIVIVEVKRSPIISIGNGHDGSASAVSNLVT